VFAARTGHDVQDWRVWRAALFFRETSMTNYVIAGAGASGLFIAWRLLKDGKLAPEDTVTVYEWSNAHIGGRIHTYPFPQGTGQFIEAGGMRFATDLDKQGKIVGGHVLVQHLIQDLGLDPLITEFVESSNRLYYLRGTHVYEADLPNKNTVLPYNFDPEFKAKTYNGVPFNHCTADDILAEAADHFAGQIATRKEWCDYFANGKLTKDLGGIFAAGTNIGDIGYWDLLYAYLGDEGFDYVSDANGYQSNVINWNSADAMQANTDFGSSVVYKRLAGGYSNLFDALGKAIRHEAEKRGQKTPSIVMHTRLMAFEHDANSNTFDCHFTDVNNGTNSHVKADYLFLAMPRRSLEMVAANCSAQNTLNDATVMNYLQSSIDQPAMRIGMLFHEAWWTDTKIVTYPMQTNPSYPPADRLMGGPSITDLPLRQVFYFANNAVGAKEGGPYVMLASYDDMTYASFWREMEIEGRRTTAPSLDYQALNGPTTLKPGSQMEKMVLDQLAYVHGVEDPKKIPAPITTIYMDWGTDPFGGGYHGWAAHYNICEVMHKVRAPATEILHKKQNLFIVGSCYSIDQAWVEGALCVAESVLEDYLGLPAFCALPPGYVLIC
jgi:flavin-dependent amine oxidoreductase